MTIQVAAGVLQIAWTCVKCYEDVTWVSDENDMQFHLLNSNMNGV